MSDRPKAASSKPPPPRASRPAVGVRARTAAILPDARALAAARTVTLTDSEASGLAAAIAALPDPADLPPGTLVVIPGEPAGSRGLARSVLAVFGRVRTIARTRRCTALVARGYVDVGATDDPHAKIDLAWGTVPAPATTDS